MVTNRPGTELIRGYPFWRSAVESDSSSVRCSWVTSRGYRIAYEDVGSGAPVLLVPGFTMSAADWREVGVVERLARSRRVLSVDPLGHGRSDKPTETAAYDWPAVVADLIRVLDAESIPRAVIWGYSRGATLACAAGIEFADRVKGVILGGCGDLTAPVERAVPAWVERLAAGDWDALFRTKGYGPQDQVYAKQHFDPRAFGASTKARRLSGYRLDLRRMKAPALVYCGTADGPQDSRRSADALGVDLTELAGLDHDTTFMAAQQMVPIVLGRLDAWGS